MNGKEFIQRWEKKVSELKNLKLSPSQCKLVAKDYFDEFIEMKKEENTLTLLEVKALKTDLDLALLQAFNNYDEYMREHNMWYKLTKKFGVKFNPHKN